MKKRGISLIVLVITIIVIVVLATAVIVSLANNNPVENANEATFKSDLANVKDLVNLASTDILLEKEGASYEGIIPDEYTEKLEIHEGVLYFKGENAQEEEWAREIGVVIRLIIPEDWIDISKSTPENGISLLIGKPELEEATIKFKVTSTGTYKVDWGDGSSASYASEVEASHTYSTNSDKLSADGYLFEAKITPDGGDITKFEHTQATNSPLLWCQIGCDTLSDCSYMLNKAINLEKFGIASGTLLNNVKNMDRIFMDCSSLTGIPRFGTSSAINMDLMFQGCSSLESIPYLDTSKVTSMSQMFNGCKNLTTIPKLDTSSLINMRSMFSGCSSLKTIPKLDTRKVTNMYATFSKCSSLTEIPELDTSNVENMLQIFSGCKGLTTIPKLDTSSATNMGSMFSSCSNLKNIPELNTSNVTNMDNMFAYCSNLTGIPKLNTSKVKSMSGMFASCGNLESISELDTSQVEKMQTMFGFCSSLKTIPELDTSKVTNMSSMFYGCSSLTNIPLLDTSQVTTMSSIFYNCKNLTNINISNANLTSEQINNVFAALPTSTKNAVIDITGNPGEGDCTRTTATGKGWVVKP